MAITRRTLTAGCGAAILVTLAAAKSALASEGPPTRNMILDLMYVELVVPELGLEVHSGGQSLLLSQPLLISIGAPSQQKPWLMGMLEPQVRLGEKTQVRGLLGLRVYAAADELEPSLFFEPAAVLGTDGAGLAVGGGFSLLKVGFPCLSVGYRAVWSGGEVRHQVILDLVTSVFGA